MGPVPWTWLDVSPWLGDTGTKSNHGTFPLEGELTVAVLLLAIDGLKATSAQKFMPEPLTLGNELLPDW